MEKNKDQQTSETFLVKNHFPSIIISQFFGYFPLSITSNGTENPRLNLKVSVTSVFAFLLLFAHVLWIVSLTNSEFMEESFNNQGATGYIIMLAWGYNILVPLIIIIRGQKFVKVKRFLCFWRNFFIFNTNLCSVLSKPVLTTYFSCMYRKKCYDYCRVISLALLICIHISANIALCFVFYFQLPISMKLITIIWDSTTLIHACNSCLMLSMMRTFAIALNALSAELEMCAKNSVCLFTKCQTVDFKPFNEQAKLKMVLNLFKQLENCIKEFCMVYSWEIFIDVIYSALEILVTIFMAFTTFKYFSTIYNFIVCGCFLVFYCEVLWHLCHQGSKITESAYEFIHQLENIPGNLMDKETKYLVSKY